jgi:hypothetical protein
MEESINITAEIEGSRVCISTSDPAAVKAYSQHILEIFKEHMRVQDENRSFSNLQMMKGIAESMKVSNKPTPAEEKAQKEMIQAVSELGKSVIRGTGFNPGMVRIGDQQPKDG